MKYAVTKLFHRVEERPQNSNNNISIWYKII